MKWVVLAIAIGIAGYTAVTLGFRKPAEAAHRPYDEARERFTSERLREAGYQRIAVTLERPADLVRARAAVGAESAKVIDAPGGLPAELAEAFAEKPKLPPAFGAVAAPRLGSAMLPYPILYTCQLPDQRDVIGETRVYVKDQSIAIITDFDRIDDELLARTKETTLLLQLPASVFRLGETFELTLVGAHASKRWNAPIR